MKSSAPDASCFCIFRETVMYYIIEDTINGILMG